MKTTVIDRLKHKIMQMNTDEFIDWCGGESCLNIICKEIPSEDCICHCNDDYDFNDYDCGKCMRVFLNRKELG